MGFAFFVLQDRHHRVQVIISPDLWEVHRQLLRDARSLIVEGPATVNGRAVTLKAVSLAELPLKAAHTAPAWPHGSAAHDYPPPAPLPPAAPSPHGDRHTRVPAPCTTAYVSR